MLSVLVGRGRGLFSFIAARVIWRIDRRQNETDDTLHEERRKQWSTGVSHREGEKEKGEQGGGTVLCGNRREYRKDRDKEKYHKQEKGEAAISNLENHDDGSPPKLKTEALKHCVQSPQMTEREKHPLIFSRSHLSLFHTLSPSLVHTHTQTQVNPVKQSLYALVHCEENSAWYELKHICFQCTKAKSEAAYAFRQSYTAQTSSHSNASYTCGACCMPHQWKW